MHRSIGELKPLPPTRLYGAITSSGNKLPLFPSCLLSPRHSWSQLVPNPWVGKHPWVPDPHHGDYRQELKSAVVHHQVRRTDAPPRKTFKWWKKYAAPSYSVLH